MGLEVIRDDFQHRGQRCLAVSATAVAGVISSAGTGRDAEKGRREPRPRARSHFGRSRFATRERQPDGGNCLDVAVAIKGVLLVICDGTDRWNSYALKLRGYWRIRPASAWLPRRRTATAVRSPLTRSAFFRTAQAMRVTERLLCQLQRFLEQDCRVDRRRSCEPCVTPIRLARSFWPDRSWSGTRR